MEKERIFGCCLQLQDVLTLDAAGLARRLHRRADEINVSSSAKDAIGRMHGEAEIL